MLWLDKCSITGGTSYHGGRLIQTIRETDNGNWVPVFKPLIRPGARNQAPALNKEVGGV